MKTRRRFWLSLSSTDGSVTTSVLGFPFSAGEVMTQTPPQQTLSLCAALLPKLGLPPHVTQTSNLPEGIDGTAIIAALMAAIGEMQPVLGLSLDRDLLAGHVLRIVATAARSLLADPKRLREAVYLTEQARADQTDSAPLAHIRIVALLQLGERAKLIAELDRLLAQEPPDARLQEILQAFVKKQRLANLISARAKNHAWLWGEFPNTLRAYLSAMPPNHGVLGDIPQKLLKFTFDNRGDQALSFEDFHRRLLWGSRAFQYIKFIRHTTVQIHLAKQSGFSISSDDQKVLDLFSQIDSMILSPDLRLLEESRDAGRTIFIVDSHAGFSLLSNLGVGKLGLPKSMISLGAGSNVDPHDFNIATSRGDLHIQILKLAKLLKKEQRLVRIVPDGPEGDLVEFDIYGHTIKLGQGAAMLAYYGRAAIFFVSSEWDGTNFRLSFKPGPVASSAQPRGDFDREFYKFYLDCLREIVSGPPEDMGLNGGFWRFFQ